MRRIATIIGLIIGIAGLGIDFAEIVPAMLVAGAAGPARSFPDVFIYFWTFFTHLTNLGLLLVYVATLSGWRWLGWFARPRTMAAMGAYILLVMIYYYVMLSGLYEMQGGLLVATWLLHYVAPVYYLVWWGLFAPHPRLRFTEIPWMLGIGIVYVAWVLVRGLFANEYPYDILDPNKLGYAGVAMGVASLLVMIVVFCIVMVGADKLIGSVKSPSR